MPKEKKKYSLLNGLENDADFFLEELRIDIIEKINIVMKKYKISKADLARRLGTSRAYITKLFSMNINLTLKSMVQIANAVGMRISIDFYKTEGKEWFSILNKVEYDPTISTQLMDNIDNEKDYKKIEPFAAKGVKHGRSSITA
ncbi:MAG: helix-turn-helix transcriptional regulator [bacterium]